MAKDNYYFGFFLLYNGVPVDSEPIHEYNHPCPAFIRNRNYLLFTSEFCAVSSVRRL